MDKRAVVIGSGFGGLATAIRLQAQGFSVTLLEKRSKPGGRAYVYEEKGFVFDAGPTVVTAPNCLEELFSLSGKRMEDYVEMLPVNPLYRLHWEDGVKFDYTDDLNLTLDQIGKLNSEDAKNYPKFLKYTEQVFEEGYVKLGHVPFLDWWSMIRVSPQLLRLESYRTVYGIVSKYLKDPHLRQAFSFHSLLVGGNPFSTSAIYTLIHFLERKWGVYFPKGGMGALVLALCRLFRDLGGEIRLDTSVKEICTQGGKVTGVKSEKGEFIEAPVVVSNADVHFTYHELLRKESRLESKRRRLQRMRYSPSLFLVYFGTDRKFNELHHHNVLFGPRYRELLQEIFDEGTLADDFSLYVHRPTVTDPSLAPEGGDTFYALSPVPHLGKSKIDWVKEGPQYADKILTYLDTRYLPGLKKSVVVQRHFTPLDFQNELLAHLGSAFSLEPILTQSAYFRFHNRDSDIEGLYLAGAGTHPGAGIPGVVGSAKATAELVLNDWNEEKFQVKVQSTASKELTQHCKQMIEVGSKSFSLAAKLFPPKTRHSAFFLYGWCRYVDDAIDEASGDENLDYLKEQTLKAFENKPVQGNVFEALKRVAAEYRIPSWYALELLEGMKMDVDGRDYESIEDLSLYCYRVAGCVGLMMSHVMGVSNPEALKNAADLGTAMQLTNIARDVLSDARQGRVYLPLDWLKQYGMIPQDILNPSYRPLLAKVVKRLLTEAERFYVSGERGLRFLHWRSALAVAVALEVYREIGRQVAKRGERAWDSRTVVSPYRKFLCVLRGLTRVVSSFPKRVLVPWRQATIETVWRHRWIPAEHF